jgi:surfeit locus 1 family protein
MLGVDKKSIVGFVVGFVFLNSLGVWQLNRAEEKRQLLGLYEAQGNSPVRKFNALTDDMVHYQSVEVSGTFHSSQYFLQDNQINNSKLGFRVISPLILESGEILLVNRGWVPVANTATRLPILSIPPKKVVVSGKFSEFPDVGYRLDYIDQPKWPKIVQYLDEALVSRWFENVLPLMLYLDDNSDYGYERNWQLINIQPEKHTAYAVQWFGIALAFLVIFVLSVRKEKNAK